MPDKRKRNPYDLRAIFEDMTLGLIASLRRNLMRHRNEEVNEGFRWEMWQKAKLRAMSGFRKVNRQLIRDALKEAQELTGEVIRQSYDDGVKRAEEQGQRAARRAAEADLDFPEDIRPTLPKPPVPPPEPVRVPAPPLRPEDPSMPPAGRRAPPRPKYDDLPHAGDEQRFFGMNERKLDALEKAAKEDIRKAGAGVLRKMDDVYKQVIFGAEVHMAAGAKTLQQAADMATREFLSRGIDNITYGNGRRINIASYAEMALRTASQRATFMGEGKKRDEWGIFTVVMSAHDNCSPWCMPYQGTVMIDDIYTTITPEQAQQLAKETSYVLLSAAMREGAFHPNCRHTLATFFPGISQLPVKPDEENAKRNYEAEQRQRYMERRIRRYKRLAAGSVDDTNRERYTAKVKEWEQKLRDHLKVNPPLRRNRWREEDKLPPLRLEERMERGARGDQRQYDRYKLLYGDELGADTLEDFQRMKYTDGKRWEELKAGRQAALNKRDYHEGMAGQFGNREVREWYIVHDKSIPDQIDYTAPVKAQAIQAHGLRVKYRTEARLMMRNRGEAAALDRDQPHKSFDELVKDKMDRKQMTAEQAYEDIVATATKTNAKVNEKFKLD